MQQGPASGPDTSFLLPSVQVGLIGHPTGIKVGILVALFLLPLSAVG